MATISNLVVSLSANSAKLIAGLKKSRGAISKWASGVRKKATALAKGVAVVGAAAAGAIVAIVNRQAAEIDKLAKKASELTIDTSSLQKLRYQAQITGVSVDGMDNALGKMLKTVNDANKGLTTSIDALDALGLKAADLEKMSVDEMFYTIAKAMGGLESQAEKTGTAMDVFGRAGRNLLNTLGSDLKAIGDEFDSLGVGINSRQAAMVEAYQDSKTKLATIWEGFVNHITVAVVPALQDVIEHIVKVTKQTGGMGNVATAALRSMAESVAFVADGLRGFEIIILTVHIGIAKMAAVLIETIRTFEMSYIRVVNRFGAGLKASVSLQVDAELEKENIGRMQVELEQLLNDSSSQIKVKTYFDGLEKRLADVSKAATSGNPLDQLEKQATNAAVALGKISGGASDLYKKLFPNKKKGPLVEGTAFNNYAKAAKARADEGNGAAFDEMMKLARKSFERFNRSDLNFDTKGMADVLKRLTESGKDLKRSDKKGSGFIDMNGQITNAGSNKHLGTIKVDMGGRKIALTGSIDEATYMVETVRKMMNDEAAAIGAR